MTDTDDVSCTSVKKGSRFGRSNLNKQTRLVIENVYKYFQNLAEYPELTKTLNFKQVQKLTAEACGVSRTTVQRIKKNMDDEEIESCFEVIPEEVIEENIKEETRESNFEEITPENEVLDEKEMKIEMNSEENLPQYSILRTYLCGFNNSK